MPDRRNRNSAVVVVLLLITCTVGGTQAHARQIPDGELAVAYRQLDEGKLSRQVFQNWLECLDGACTLTTLTLGQCIAGAFYPKLERWTTADRSLSVTLAAPGVLHAGFRQGGAAFQLRFRFEGSVRFGHLRAFSGGAVKQSDLLNKVITWQLVPLKHSIVQFDCPASLDYVRE